MFILSSGCLYKYGLNRIFEFAKDAGFEGVEIVMNEIFDTRDADYINKLQEHFAMPVVAMTLLSITSSKKVKVAIDVAQAIKAPTVILRSPLFTDFKLAQWFKNELPKLQKKTNIQLAVENTPAGKGFFLPQFALRNIEELRRFEYLCLDTSHLVTQKLSLLRVYKLIHKRLVHVHISNFNAGKEHQFLDEGEVPLESFLTHLKRDGFDKPISLKVTPEVLGGNDASEVAKRLKKARDFYEEYYLKD